MALKCLKRAFELSPMETQYAIQLGDLNLTVRRYHEAQPYYDLAVRFLPDHAAAYVSKALLLWTWKGSANEARDALESMPAEGRQSSYGLIHWFWQDLFEGRYQDAIDRVTGSSSEVINLATRELLLAQAYGLLGSPDSARRSYDKARSLFQVKTRPEPGDFWALASLALALAGLGEREEAIVAGKEAARQCKDPLDGGVLLKNLALVYTMLGMHEDALDQIAHLLTRPTIPIEYLPLVPSTMSIPMLRLDPRWKPLWDHPRFREFVDRYGNPSEK